jgi:hypothetical protein
MLFVYVDTRTPSHNVVGLSLLYWIHPQATIEEKERIKDLRESMQKLQSQLREKKSELVTVVSPLKPKKPEADHAKAKDEQSEAGPRKRRAKKAAVVTATTASSGEEKTEQTTTATSMDTPRSRSWFTRPKVRQPNSSALTSPTGLELFLIGALQLLASILCRKEFWIVYALLNVKETLPVVIWLVVI